MLVRYVVALLLLMFWGSGKWLDWNAEHLIHQRYTRDDNGIIKGLEPIRVRHAFSRKALVLIHGFGESPATYAEFIKGIQQKSDIDIYAPLLPYHAHDLETLAALDQEVVVDNIKQYLDRLSKKYRSMTVVGFSYSGTILVQLAKSNRMPENAKIILYAPAVFIKMNTWIKRMQIHAYGYWRSYCNYAALGCYTRASESGDEASRAMFAQEKSLLYKVIPAVLKLYELDLNNRESLAQIKKPYALIVAVDDNRVDFVRLKQACDVNQTYCHFYPFSSGKHVIHWGKNKTKLEDLIIRLMRKKEA